MQNFRLKPNRLTSALLLTAAMIVSAAAVIMCVLGVPGVPLNCADFPDPQVTVREYFDLLGQGRYEECDAYLLDFSLVEMAQPSEGEMVSTLRSLLEESYSCSMEGDSEITAMTASQSVTVTYLDLPHFGAAVKDEADRLAEELSFQGVDVAEKEKAIEIGVQALEKMKEKVQAYYVSDEIVVKLEYTNKEWKICYNHDLERMIMGDSAK